jgi:hypothetical protein
MEIIEMGRPKGSRNKDESKPKKKGYNDHLVRKNKDPMVEEIVEIEVEFNCPINGRMVQKVKVKRLKSVATGPVFVVSSSNEEIDTLDKIDDSEQPIFEDEND